MNTDTKQQIEIALRVFSGAALRDAIIGLLNGELTLEATHKKFMSVRREGTTFGFGSDQAKDLKSCDNSRKPAPKLGLESHFQPQNRHSKIKDE